jgi:hypothetical protein
MSQCIGSHRCSQLCGWVTHEVAILTEPSGPGLPWLSMLSWLSLLIGVGISPLCLGLRRRWRRRRSKLWDCRDMLWYGMVKGGRRPIVLALHPEGSLQVDERKSSKFASRRVEKRARRNPERRSSEINRVMEVDRFRK